MIGKKHMKNLKRFTGSSDAAPVPKPGRKPKGGQTGQNDKQSSSDGQGSVDNADCCSSSSPPAASQALALVQKSEIAPAYSPSVDVGCNHHFRDSQSVLQEYWQYGMYQNRWVGCGMAHSCPHGHFYNGVWLQ